MLKRVFDERGKKKLGQSALYGGGDFCMNCKKRKNLT